MKFTVFQLRFFLPALVGLAVVGLLGCIQRFVPLYTPAPITVPKNAQMSDVTRAVKSVLARRGWIVEDEQPGSVRARLSVDGHTATIKVSYNLSETRIEYVDSQNLHYWNEDNIETIHARYNIWIRNLEKDLNLVYSFL